jgi:hypothetical protein
MPTNTKNAQYSIGGISIQSLISRTGEGQLSVVSDTPLVAGNAGTLSTRTSDTAGTMTLSGHDISTGDNIDIFWTDANGDLQVAYDATVGTVAGDSVPFTGASGVVLPAQDYAVIADERVIATIAFDGDDATMFVGWSDRNSHMEFLDSGTLNIHNQTVVAGEAFDWTGSGSNPLTGNAVATIAWSNGDSSNTATMKFAVQTDAVP